MGIHTDVHKATEQTVSTMSLLELLLLLLLVRAGNLWPKGQRVAFKRRFYCLCSYSFVLSIVAAVDAVASLCIAVHASRKALAVQFGTSAHIVARGQASDQ